MGHSEISCILLLIFNLRLVTSCGLEEYTFQDLCCPMCHAGSRVSKHCTSSTPTTCVPCARGAFTDHSNGLEKCFKCKYCDPELGLHTVRECTEIQDTVCDCKEGYICLAKRKDGCHMCTKYIPHLFNGSTNIKGMMPGDPRHHEARPTAQSGITHNVVIKFLGQDDARNPSMLGNKTAKKKIVSKSEISTTKEEPAPETTTGKPKLGRGHDLLTSTKILMTLMQTIDPGFPKESLKLQEAGNIALTEFQNITKASLVGLQSIMQTGLASIRIAIQSGMTGLQGAMKTGMADIQSALQTGMTGIQETLKSGMSDIKGIKNGIIQVENTLKQLQTNSQSNSAQMTKQVGALVNVLTKLASNQSVSFIQLKDVTCKLSNKTEAKLEAKQEAKPEVKQEVKQEAKQEAKPEGKTEAKQEAKQEAKPEGKTETKQEAKPEGKTEVNTDLKTEAIQLQVTEKQP
ncbi:uncharacterized protein LOC119950577 isoform X3 [Scyliorhinus canicula]|uniref:uncharacterized protein LOC119950577 isoform X3 n=1 Tax=Scyliorhinus canicula TaxID=7830 RepID=UPI0018F3B872|nr:uncharacterized protein LOC119950577 isoform X3 [Scyliorhinus canicula]XP_038629050.1 uncharacterized protein LOC119950577 isoform X3 [Scyliorhinus canicula]